MSALVLGIGNVLLRDEGVGVRVIEELYTRYTFPREVELLDGGTSGIELLSYIRGREMVVIIDAMINGYSPGMVFRIEGNDVPAVFMTSISPHQFGISGLLATARLIEVLPENMILFGVEPKDMGTGISLSEEVEDGMNRAVDAVVLELRKNGYRVYPRLGGVGPPLGFWSEKRMGNSSL